MPPSNSSDPRKTPACVLVRVCLRARCLSVQSDRRRARQAALARRQPLALAMRATVVSRIRATVAAFAAKEKDIYRLNPLGPKPKRILGVVYNSQVRRAGP